jgi:hypothetical protein
MVALDVVVVVVVVVASLALHASYEPVISTCIIVVFVT